MDVKSYWEVASISHFCNIFGKIFKLPSFEPEELEQAFIYSKTNEEGETQPLLVQLAIALLEPHFNSRLNLTNWENYLKRIIDSNWVGLENHPSPLQIPLVTSSGVDLIKNLTFDELSISDKIDIFYALCDYRLWCEDAAEAIKDYPLEVLRLESIGKDSQGYEYWYFSGTRLFRENKELSQDLIKRKTRIKELEYNLIELERQRILKEQEEQRKAELERSRQLAAEAREAKLAAKKEQQQQQEIQTKKRKSATPILPPRTGLRERRSSTTSNNNNNPQNKQKQQPEPQETRTTRSKLAKLQQQDQQQESTTSSNSNSTTSTPKTTRGKNSKHNDKANDKCPTPDVPKKSPEEECKEELEKIAITPEDRAEAWHIQCDSLEDWESFAVKFEKSKSTNEKYLSNYINEELLPKIRAIYAKRAAEIRRKEKELLLSLSSRRVSTRIISKQKQEEEEERLAQIREAEIRQKKIEAESRLRAELEREIRTRQNKFVINGGTSSTCSEDGHIEPIDNNNARYNLRQTINSNGNEFDGIIHPDNLSDFYEAIELVIDTVRTSKHAWPFVNPVPETEPGYYDLIKEPMDLWKIRTKIEFREYKSFLELEKDFQLLVNNCEKFNGPRNVYTKMVYKLWKSFRKNVRLYLERDLTMDEYETFLYPPEPVKPPTPPPQPSPKMEIDLPPVKEEFPSYSIKDNGKVYENSIQPEINSNSNQVNMINNSNFQNQESISPINEEIPVSIETGVSPIRSVVEKIEPLTLPDQEEQVSMPYEIIEEPIKQQQYEHLVDEFREELPPEPVMELEI